jgi:hypothetical protein
MDCFRNYLFEVGLISFTDSTYIRASCGINTLASYLMAMSGEDIYDLSERVYHTWLDRNVSNGVGRLAHVLDSRARRLKYARMVQWFKVAHLVRRERRTAALGHQ